ncbi:MAG: DUF1887 family CARF protein [Nitrospinota bacterium]
MKTILISLISEQTIPNILVTAYYKPHILWFITTERSERGRRTECIENTLKLKGLLPSPVDIKKVIVDQDSLTDCISKVESLIEKIHGEVEYIVNITGGNKVMALAAYEIFREIRRQKVVIGYMPLGKNEFLQIFPRKRPLKIYEIKELLNLEEYLMSYGFIIQNKHWLQEIKAKAISRKEISRWILENYEQLKGVLDFLWERLHKKRRDKNYKLSETFERELTKIESEMLNKHGFEVKGRLISKDITKDEIVYLTGGWFEEYIFNEVYSLVQDGILDDAMIDINIESLDGTKNELDIAFMKDNVFYFIECKTLGGEEELNVIREEVYKKGAISTLLGKGENRGIICTTHHQIGESLSARARDYGIEILTMGQVRELKKWIVEKFKGVKKY